MLCFLRSRGSSKRCRVAGTLQWTGPWRTANIGIAELELDCCAPVLSAVIKTVPESESAGRAEGQEMVVVKVDEQGRLQSRTSGAGELD